MSAEYSDYSDDGEFVDEKYSENEDYVEYDENNASDDSDGRRLNEIINTDRCKNENFETASVSSRNTSISVLDDEFSMKSGVNNIFERCNYCGSAIRCTPMEAKAIYTEEEYEQLKESEYFEEATATLHFCDICCAKLFHDSLHPVNINYKEYNKALNENRLDKFTADMYKKVGHTPFGALPVYLAAIEGEQIEGLSEADIMNNRVIFHNIYRKVIRNAINY